MAPSRNLGSIDRGRSEIINDGGIVLSSAVSSEIQSIDESGLSELIKDAADEFRFS